jgi:thymidine kinase
MYRRGDRGWVEVITGPMFSGKSEELIRRVTRSRIARIPVQVFKPVIDTRFADAEVVSHSSLSVGATPVPDAATLLDLVEESTVVIGVDEAQFFDASLIEVTDALARSGRQVIVAGLDLDYLGRPFPPIPTLAANSEYVTKMLAVCHRCGAPASYTQRIIRSSELVVLGAAGAYEARCRLCFDPLEPEQTKLDVE